MLPGAVSQKNGTAASKSGHRNGVNPTKTEHVVSVKISSCLRGNIIQTC